MKKEFEVKVSYGLNCVPPNILTLRTSVTLFGNVVFIDVIKLK